MQMTRILPLENGAHDNQTYHGILPDGWAVIPDGIEMENFPFGDVEVEEQDVDGIGVVPVVTKWIPGILPEPEPEPMVEPSEMERLRADLDYLAIMAGVEL